jgi:hypothetical protein
MSATAFSVQYQPIFPGRPELGQTALIPWDMDIFGFPIADYKMGEPETLAKSEAVFRSALLSWIRSNSVTLMSCSVPAQHLIAMPALSRTGFSFVELGLRASLAALHKVPPVHSPLRLSVPADIPALESIAATAFRAGRYNADPQVPPEAAAQRYVRWLKRALSAVDPGDRVFVMGEEGNPTCFFHLRLADGMADLRLAGVRLDLQGGALGYRLYGATLQWLKEQSVRRVTARLSATNTAVLNLYASLGFSFSNPEIVLHWHA